MATRSQLVARTRILLNERDSSNSHWTDEEIRTALGQGVRFLGTVMEWAQQTSEATSQENKRTYGLPSDFISLVDVYFDSKPLSVVSREDMPSINSDWMIQEAGEPQWAYKSDNAQIGLHPKPSSDYASKQIQIHYVKVPPSLENDDAEPDLHVSFHDCLPFYAAYFLQKGLGNENTSKSHMNDFEKHAKILMARVQRFADSLMAFRWG